MNQQKYKLLYNKDVTIRDSFLDGRVGLVKDVVIPYQWEILNDRIKDAEPSHAIDNFRIAAGLKKGSFYGQIFQDSDLYKWLEAVGNILLTHPDAELEAEADEVIAIIGKAQQEDGYLNTYFTLEAPERRWTNLLECHELYCAGHFIEAAAAYYETTGKEPILEIARGLADHIDGVFGAEEGKKHGYPGHQEIELALLRLYDVTGEERYYHLAAFFLDTRGINRFFEEEFEKRDRISHWLGAKLEEPNQRYNQFPYSYYNQFHLPVRQQTEAVGHAVRGVYMYAAMADLAARSRDESLKTACHSLWDSIVKKQMYITGGIGATHSGEAFTVEYDLPNDTNYAETCASVGLIFFAQKMLQMDVDAGYGDVMEKAFYNTVLGGMSQDGSHFFYVNPLEVVPECCHGNTERNHVKPIRQKWFTCACCPPNIARLLSSLQKYIYSYAENTVYLHLYFSGEAVIPLESGNVRIRQEGNYPWDGKISLRMEGDSREEITLALRIPGWCRCAGAAVNGIPVDREALTEKGYLYLKRIWKKTDEITLTLDMAVEQMRANKKVHYDAGRIAIQRGPLVYCLEEADNGKYLNQISIAGEPELKAVFEPELLGGCVTISGKAFREKEADEGEADMLYAPLTMEKQEIMIKALPYFLWNNREPGEMQVWIRKSI